MSNDVHELLGRAAEDAGQPATSTRTVYAGVARVRLRRRVTVSVAAVAVVAAGAVAAPNLAPKGDTQETSVAAPVELAGNGGRAKELAKVLPRDVGAVAQVSLSVILKGDTTQREMPHLEGPLDGHFSVRRDGGVGYLVIGYMDTGKPGAADPNGDPCKPAQGQPGLADCVNEELPDGRVLTTWSDPMNYEGAPPWGQELVGRLTLKDGGVLAVRDSTGFKGERAQGPLLKTLPLTRAQLRELLLSPELLPKK
ncbi:hypothetical protein OG978_27540 [Streptomyces sp. NBC_01591]|uniref:hypothetical protein n=1 Tax=Streptomyces sp. NBC_01591 TaxID=2975888 RepID=UPI002DD8DC2C|nr:hypothetical protein [Streptomyces sp. NBC_01591]WSD70806.1 hypothetical protein OG978_27540 [Streptomyces sp. NBC_01591]